jgi:hypothetical protein
MLKNAKKSVFALIIFLVAGYLYISSPSLENSLDDELQSIVKNSTLMGLQF